MESNKTSNASDTTAVEESMTQLGSGSEGFPPYPERPGETDCAFYMRKGSCGYGQRCRYNHPRDRGAVTVSGEANRAAENQEPLSRQTCQHFLRTGTCYYGSACKYDHSTQVGFVHPVPLNCFGYPLRQGERECPYYMRTGFCKFGSNCKFHHPEPVSSASVSLPGPTFYPPLQPPSLPSPRQHPTIDAPNPSALPLPYINYGPICNPPMVFPVPGWSPYPPLISAAVSTAGNHIIQAGQLNGSQNKLSPLAPPYLPMSSSAVPSTSSKEVHMLPQRFEKLVCHNYIRKGSCRFGPTCKYHHPNRSIPEANCSLNSVGLPLRPGAERCIYYYKNGVCKYGVACKFDHPVGTLRYSPSASSLMDFPVAPYPVGPGTLRYSPSASSLMDFQVAPYPAGPTLTTTLAQSSSFSELQSELISDKEAPSVQSPPSDGTSGDTVDAMLSKGSRDLLVSLSLFNIFSWMHLAVFNQIFKLHRFCSCSGLWQRNEN